MIESALPSDWHELQDKAAQILKESGFEARTDHQIPLARGTVRVDVLARDLSATPPTIYVCECKNWQRAVSKDIVHAFRAVVIDAGAHRGFIISSGGFQRGAYEAADYSNVDLVDWSQFQQLFAERWFGTFMVPTLLREGDALREYTEPVNSRIARKAADLPTNPQGQFRQLREKYAVGSLGLLMLWLSSSMDKPKIPVLPLRLSLGLAAPEVLPADILDAPALRPLMNAVSRFYRQATAEFDEVFGGRA